MQHSIGKHTMVLQNISRMIWFISANPTPLLAYVASHKLLMPVTENAKQIAHKTDNSGSLVNKIDLKSNTAKSDSQSGNKLSQSKNNPGLTQSKGSTSEQKEPTSNPPKLGKDGKLTPQECQCCLNNKFAFSVAPLDIS